MIALVIAVALAGCSEDPTLPRGDAARSDATAIDAGDPVDAQVGSDAREPIDATASIDAPAATDAIAVDAGDARGAGCAWRTVLERPGLVHTVVEGDSGRDIPFLAPGEAFFCARVSVTMQTADNLAEVDAMYDGCPIFSHIAGIRGTTREGRNMGGAFFRLLRLDCTARRPGAVQLDAWGEPMGRSETETASAWAAGRRYRVVLEVVPFVSSITLYDPDTGAQLGPVVPVDISGSTIDMTRDPVVVLGLPRVYDGAYFPYFGATYSDLVVEAAVAP